MIQCLELTLLLCPPSSTLCCKTWNVSEMVATVNFFLHRFQFSLLTFTNLGKVSTRPTPQRTSKRWNKTQGSNVFRHSTYSITPTTMNFMPMQRGVKHGFNHTIMNQENNQCFILLIHAIPCKMTVFWKF